LLEEDADFDREAVLALVAELRTLVEKEIAETRP